MVFAVHQIFFFNQTQKVIWPNEKNEKTKINLKKIFKLEKVYKNKNFKKIIKILKYLYVKNRKEKKDFRKSNFQFCSNKKVNLWTELKSWFLKKKYL